MYKNKLAGYYFYLPAPARLHHPPTGFEVWKSKQVLTFVSEIRKNAKPPPEAKHTTDWRDTRTCCTILDAAQWAASLQHSCRHATRRAGRAGLFCRQAIRAQTPGIQSSG